MTDMRRITISFDKEAENAVNELKEAKNCSLAKAVCELIKLGYQASKQEAHN